jgi:hypothetical protein
MKRLYSFIVLLLISFHITSGIVPYILNHHHIPHHLDDVREDDNPYNQWLNKRFPKMFSLTAHLKGLGHLKARIKVTGKSEYRDLN